MHSSTWSPWWFLTWERRAYAHAHRNSQKQVSAHNWRIYWHCCDFCLTWQLWKTSTLWGEKRLHFQKPLPPVYQWSWVTDGKIKQIAIKSKTSLALLLHHRQYIRTHKTRVPAAPPSSELCVHTPVEVGGLGSERLRPHVNFLTSKIPSSPQTNGGSHSTFPLDSLCCCCLAVLSFYID